MNSNIPSAGDAHLSLIRPLWPAPAHVGSAVTLRYGGVSAAPYTDFNLALHVGDDEACVRENRHRLRQALHLPQEPSWLRQVHGTQVVVLPVAPDALEADASVSRTPGVACAILTADCLPVLFCNTAGTVVAAAHAGWRGLLNGVLENTVRTMNGPASEIMAWLGPAIGPSAFEVGAEVRDAFVSRDVEADAAFVASRSSGQFVADLYALARLRLQAAGVVGLYGGGDCTYTDAERYYSYRRDPRTGRIASLIWLQAAA